MAALVGRPAGFACSLPGSAAQSKGQGRRHLSDIQALLPRVAQDPGRPPLTILGSIFSKILGHHGIPETDPSHGSLTAPQASGTPSLGSAAPPPVGTSASSQGAAPAPSSPAAAAPAGSVDVAAVLDGLASKSGQTLDWRHSIVDMMKLVGLDSALASRQALARELNYTGDMHDSAGMNIWLHKQVIAKLAQNGGKVPDDLRS